MSNRRLRWGWGEGVPVKLWWISRGHNPIELRTLQPELFTASLATRDKIIIRVETHSSLFDFFLAATVSHSQPVLMINFVLTAKTRLSSCEARSGSCRPDYVSLGLLDWWLLGSQPTPCQVRSGCGASLPSQPHHDLLNHWALYGIGVAQTQEQGWGFTTNRFTFSFWHQTANPSNSVLIVYKCSAIMTNFDGSYPWYPPVKLPSPGAARTEISNENFLLFFSYLLSQSLGFICYIC